MSLVGGYAPQPYPAAPATDLYYHPAHHHSHHGGGSTPGAAVATMGMSHLQSRYPEHAPADGPGYFTSAWMLGGGGGGGGPGDMAADGYYTTGHPGDHYSMLSMMAGDGPPMRIRVVKRRCTANKKERRRTVSINTAFANLRGCIPNVPSDTKLSKIKTLRLATSYIAYLMDVLNKDDPKLAEGGFKAEISKKTETREERRRKEQEEMMNGGRSTNVESPGASDGSGCGAASSGPPSSAGKKGKGRTGWPQHVWASELKS